MGDDVMQLTRDPYALLGDGLLSEQLTLSLERLGSHPCGGCPRRGVRPHTMRTCVRMRWSNLAAEAEERTRLPGYRDEALVRHFEAPGAIQTRFYEVRAKSILNRVPEASRMPFRWTINPYRGCTHACSYCSSYETPILMGNGRHKQLAEVEVGDRIYGTRRDGLYRKYTVTTVLDKWTVVKPAYRVVLEDGTELITSGDHRFLSNRGWKHVENTPSHEPDRPHLTPDNSLAGTGAFAPQPPATPDYRRGYLTGIIRGDGHIGTYAYDRPSRAHGEVYRFRLALTDLEALRRARDYLRDEDVVTSERVLQRAAPSHREVVAISTSSRSLVDRTKELVEWPILPSLDWCRGFLAGIFDAEGSRSAFALRIANTDPQLLAWIEACAKRLGFDIGHDRTTNVNGLTCIRIRGGLAEHLRFFHLTDPANTRKRSIEGQMVKTFANLKVAAIEPLDRLPLCDITTGTRRLHRKRRRQPQLLRPPDPQVPRLRRRPGLRAGDRRQGQCAGAAAGRAGASVVEGRARRARYEHRSVSVGRGSLQADDRDLGGIARRGQSVLGADQVPAAAARSSVDEGDRRSYGVQRGALDTDDRRARLAGDRAAHAESARAARGRRRADAGGDQNGRAGRAADAGYQRRSRAGRARSWSSRPRPARPT